MFQEDRAKQVEFTPAILPYQQHLLAAASLIRTHGLAKFTQRDNTGAMCIHGAISMAAYGKIHGPTLAKDCEAVRAVRDYLVMTGDTANGIITPTISGVAEWNNIDERTADEVIAVLEAAALSRALALQTNSKG